MSRPLTFLTFNADDMLLGMVRAENVRRVELIGSLLAELLTSQGRDVLIAVPQFDVIVELLFQVVNR